VRTRVVLAVLTASVAPVYAQTGDNQFLPQARDAWNNADFDVAPGLYKKALDQGGLARPDVVEAYARIGAAMAIAGKKREASRAFRRAALLDPGFEVPPEAGKVAAALAAAARTAQARSGTLSLDVQVPDQVDTGSAIGIDVTVRPARATPVAKIVVTTRDSLTARSDEQAASVSPGTAQHFDVPARLTLPDATLVVRVRAKDAHDNELVSAEKRVHVAPAAVVPAPVAVLGPAQSRPAKKEESKDSGGFWSSPWPYVIGGTALAAAGGVTAWVLTRPTDNADVGQVRVQLVH
jgi:hypothetical protein